MMNTQTEEPVTKKSAPASQEKYPESAVADDEINLLELLYVLVKYKIVIIILCVIGFAAGFIAARVKGPSFIAEAVLTAKESDRQTPNLGALGAFGGLAGLNIAGNPGLEKIQLLLNSRKFNSEFIDKYDLTTDIYANTKKMCKVYQKFYDTTSGKWNEDIELGTPEQLAGVLSGKFKKNITKDGTLELQIKSGDSVFSYKTLDVCLEYLNNHIQTSVQTEAKENVDYLEKQLLSISDPLLREKLQEKIAGEIEKAMIVSKEAFKVLDRPFCYKQHKEKKLYPIAGAFAMFFLSSAALIFFHYILGAGNNNGESRRWVEMIRKEMKRII
ncbi:MAG: hypothetical protein LBB56_01520 [Chitinispirillales bacterium]|jgi:LPS O-antigen subunit length determinant protein (WzzB/FepE family)|nr:hypothetical protein [Chitinispirillales bacterium]